MVNNNSKLENKKWAGYTCAIICLHECTFILKPFNELHTTNCRYINCPKLAKHIAICFDFQNTFSLQCVERSQLAQFHVHLSYAWLYMVNNNNKLANATCSGFLNTYSNPCHACVIIDKFCP